MSSVDAYESVHYLLEINYQAENPSSVVSYGFNLKVSHKLMQSAQVREGWWPQNCYYQIAKPTNSKKIKNFNY